MMQQKRIVGALIAEKKEKAAQQAASQRAKDDYRAGEKAYDIAQAKAIQQQARDDYRAGERGYAVQQAEKSQVQAGLSAYYESRKVGEEQTASTSQPSWLSNLWNAGTFALGGILLQTKNVGGEKPLAMTVPNSFPKQRINSGFQPTKGGAVGSLC